MPFSLSSPKLRSNIRNLYFDIAWFGVCAGSTLSFLGIYAARLGASNFQIGLLSAGPAVVNLLFTLPTGRWVEGRSLSRAAFWSALAQRLGYLPMIILPWVVISGAGQNWCLILLTLVMSVPGTILAIVFNSLFAEVVPPERLGEVVGKRNALLATSVTVSTLLCGQILDHVVFPINYQIVFAIGAIGALMSTFYVGKIRMGHEAPSSENHPLRHFSGSNGKPLLRLDVLRGPFGVLMSAYLVFYTFQYLVIPLVPPYTVQDLGLTDGEISLGNAIFYIVMMAVSLPMGRLSARFGNRRLLVFGGLTLGLYPFLNSLAHDATLYCIASAVGGASWAILSVGLANCLMERSAKGDRPAYMTIHNLALNLGMLMGSLTGPLLGDWVGLRTALLIGTGLRVLAGVFLWAATDDYLSV